MSLFVNLLQHGAGLSLRPVAVATAVLTFSGLSAQAAPMDEVVVSATRTEQRLSDVLADVTVVGSETIERSGFDSVAQLLSRQPGVQITTTGGPATNTTVMVRGANTQYTAIYLDGVRLDSQVTSGGATWANIPLALIDRIEILRGPAAAVYGSDAVAGVILLTTKKGGDGWHPYVGAGYGTHGTYKADAGISGGSGQWDYSLAMVREGSRGFDAQPENPLSHEEGFGRTGINSSLGLKVDSVHALRMNMTQTKSQSDYVFTSGNNQYHRDMKVLGATWVANWSSIYKSTLNISTSQDKYIQRPTNSLTDARLNNYLWQNEFALSSSQKLTAIFERREDSLVNPSVQNSAKQSRHQNAFALGYGITLSQHVWQLNARRDIDSEFGGENTASAAYAWNLASNWSLGASAGTSFRVPTLYQRFYEETDASLKPEHGRNKEVSLRWRQGDDHLSFTAYRNKIRNMIKYKSVGSGSNKIEYYENVERAVLEGVTLAGGYRMGSFKWHGSVDFQNPKNTVTNHLLERRSKRFATIGVETTVAGTDLGAELYAASRRYNRITDKQMSLDGYALVHLTASKQIAKNFTLSARVDNLFDRDYELAQGYATAGRTLYVGLKWMPQ